MVFQFFTKHEMCHSQEKFPPYNSLLEYIPFQNWAHFNNTVACCSFPLSEVGKFFSAPQKWIKPNAE